MFTRMLILTLLGVPTVALGANRYYIGPGSLDSSSADPQPITILAENDTVVLGYSLAVIVDVDLLEVLAVSPAGTVAADADFFDGGFVAASGEVGIGCVFDTDGDFSVQRLDPGVDHVLASIDVRVMQEVDAMASVTFGEANIHGPANPPIKNVMTNSEGFSIKPGGVGALNLVVQNGSVQLSSGPPDPIPEIQSIAPPSGIAGTAIVIGGVHFDEAGFAVEICGQPAVFEPPTDGGTRVEVTAPDCEVVGPVVVRVCNEHGCDQDDEGFTYTQVLDEVFVRGDADASGDINLTDGVVILIWSFQGGPEPNCLDAADTDDSGDINLTDPIRVFQWLFLGGAAPVDPEPSGGAYLRADCGTDPSPGDAFDCALTPPTCA